MAHIRTTATAEGPYSSLKGLIVDIHVMVNCNWHLLKQGLRRPVSRDHITDLDLELIQVTRFF